MMKKIFLAAALALAVSCSNSVLTSPDKRLSVSADDNLLEIELDGNSVQKIEIAAGLLKGSGPVKKVRDSYPMLNGKSAVYSSEARSTVFSYDSAEVEVRVYDTGVAFRFLDGERRIAYIIPDGLRRWLGAYGFTGYEALFPEQMSCEPGKWIYPALVEYSDGVFGFIAEAGIERNHSCSHLVSGEEQGVYEVETTDANPDYEVTPWRFVTVGSLADIVESTIVEDLSSPCRIEDTSWIEPGMSSWIYWAYNHGSKDYGIITGYIDLAVEMGWPYCLVDWEWPDMEGGTIEDVMAYAGSKGIKINLWYNSGTSWTGPGSPQPEDRLRTAEAREKEFAWLESLGVAGIKVDFFSEDGAEMVNYYIDILEDAAKHHLLVDFHGSTIPRGWQRTYPNLLSMEAVYGAEWYNNVPFFTARAASHNATLPFTRNVMGPMDYTPCTFTDSQHPHITSNAHELALPILFQSGLQNMADRPEAYLGQSEAVRGLLSSLPAVWDETRLLDGYPGYHVVMARRSGSKWFIAGINGTDEDRTLAADLSTLCPGMGELTLFSDSADGSAIETSTVAGPAISIDCLPRGGFVATAETK